MKKCSSLVLGVLAVVLLNSCKKNSYLTDGGLHSAQPPLSTYEYLKQHSWQSFDTLITIIDH
jgi:hypothetical protein